MSIAIFRATQGRDVGSCVKKNQKSPMRTNEGRYASMICTNFKILKIHFNCNVKKDKSPDNE